MVSAAITGTSGVMKSDSKAGVSKSKETGTDFMSVLMSSVTNISAQKSSQDAGSVINQSVQTDKSGVDVKSDAAASDTVQNKVKTADSSESKADVKTEKADGTDKSSAKVSDEDGDVADKVNEAGQKIYDAIKDELGLTDEQLTQAMEILGLTMADLLVKTNVTDLVVEATGAADAMSILTEESLSNGLMNISNMLDNELAALSDDTGISPEALADMIKSDEFAAVDAEETVSADDAAKDVADDAQAADEVTDDSQSKSLLEDVIASKIVGKDATTNEQTGGEAGKNSGHSDNKSDGAGEINAQAQANGNVVSDISKSFESALVDTEYQVNAADVIDQIVESIKLNSTSELKSMEIMLNPQNLGKVNLLVSVREGVVTAKIVAENEQVQKALESQIITLKENIQNQGIKIDEVQVTVSTNAFESNEQFEQERQEQTRKTTRRLRLDGFDDSEDEEEEQMAVNYNENSSVEYSA